MGRQAPRGDSGSLNASRPPHDLVVECVHTWLMGMCTNLTKKPMKPIMRKPMPVAKATLLNSVRGGCRGQTGDVRQRVAEASKRVLRAWARATQVHASSETDCDEFSLTSSRLGQSTGTAGLGRTCAVGLLAPSDEVRAVLVELPDTDRHAQQQTLYSVAGAVLRTATSRKCAMHNHNCFAPHGQGQC